MTKKLFIQIPCLNESDTIKAVINNIPRNRLRELGFTVKVLVVDDGSSDQTSKRAKIAGADYILRHKRTQGLAKSFMDGLKFCINKGADIVVNTDGDNQYDQREILNIIKPIIDESADMVIGDRQINRLKFMPLNKKIGNIMGSWVIRNLTATDIPDASSGFRALKSELVKFLNIQSTHTYTHESIIQANIIGAKIMSVPITFKKRGSGDSRLIADGILEHVKKSLETIVKSILLYNAFKYLLIIGSTFSVLGLLIGTRFLYFYFHGKGAGHIQSLVLSSVLINLGFLLIILGILADLISINRKTLEEINSKIT